MTGCAERFLGAEVCAHPIVLASKINANAADDLDQDITLEELDDSIKLSNKSASGMDGFSNCF